MAARGHPVFAVGAEADAAHDALVREEGVDQIHVEDAGDALVADDELVVALSS